MSKKAKRKQLSLRQINRIRDSWILEGIPVGSYSRDELIKLVRSHVALAPWEVLPNMARLRRKGLLLYTYSHTDQLYRIYGKAKEGQL